MVLLSNTILKLVFFGGEIYSQHFNYNFFFCMCHTYLARFSIFLNGSVFCFFFFHLGRETGNKCFLWGKLKKHKDLFEVNFSLKNKPIHKTEIAFQYTNTARTIMSINTVTSI